MGRGRFHFQGIRPKCSQPPIFRGTSQNALLAGVVSELSIRLFCSEIPYRYMRCRFLSGKTFRGSRVFVTAVARCICRDCAACYGFFMDSLTVEVIFRGFGEQEDIFMGFRTPVFHTFRHGVRLCPNNILPQKPAVRP